jgi:hypothetical protein
LKKRSKKLVVAVADSSPAYSLKIKVFWFFFSKKNALSLVRCNISRVDLFFRRR